ncbi:hypothetical protein [Nitrincola sp. MINF-07-Sa-05]|uniref:hypothetical protein n=1 Tax=Nitrincola salilacus TaxID=3400273 RepID=UPI0039185365
MMTVWAKSIIGGLAAGLLLLPMAIADQLPAPEGRVVLTVSGKIQHHNQDGAAVFDQQMLERLEQHEVQTGTPWTDKVMTFSGPLGSALMEAVGAEGSTLRVTAINEYSAEVPVSDFAEFPVILALKADDQYLRVRDKGPLFIIYPFDSHPELNNEVYYTRSVWQIKAIEVQ